jgi:hypothetical protein
MVTPEPMTGAHCREKGNNMTGELTLPVPATCTAWYLVPTPIVLLEAAAAQRFALARVDEYESVTSRPTVHDAVDASAVTFAGVTADDLTPAQRAPMRRVGPWISVRVTLPTGLAPVHERVARKLIYPLAEEMELPAADMVSGREVSADELRATLHPRENGLLRMCDWVGVSYARGDGWESDLTTVGMCRYGLPELAMKGVAPMQERQACAVLTAIALRVRQEFVEAVLTVTPPTQRPPDTIPREIRIPAEIRVHDDDVRAAYCLPGSYRSRDMRWSQDGLVAPDQLVGLAFDNGAHGILQVRPPYDWAGSAGDFLESLISGPMSHRKAVTEPFVQEFQESRYLEEGIREVGVPL